LDRLGPRQALEQQLREQRRERELATELERLLQHVGGEAVGKRGDGRIVVRR